MISKELLGEVLKDDLISALEYSCDYPSVILYNHSYEVKTKTINIYELAHKCKEWALNQDYVLYSGSRHRLSGFTCTIYTYNGEIEDDFSSNTEPEAIFKACQWILESKKGIG